MENCIFCKIISGQIHAEVVYQNDKVIAFKDINPVAPVHVLIVPKEHLSGINDLNKNHAEMLLDIHLAAQEVAKRLGVHDAGYRIISNCGKSAGQTVFHLHYHLLGGRDMEELLK